MILGDGPNGFLLVSPGNGGLRTPTTGDPVQTVMAYGFGRSDGAVGNNRLTKARGQQNLALILKIINGAKNFWFGGKAPTAIDQNDKSAKAGRERIRNAVSPFKFLNFQPTDGSDAPWNKWMRVSNWIDLVCYTFDQQYPWGQGIYPGEPTNSAGTPSLRALYAEFIDAYMAAIEATARAWSASAKSDFLTYYPPASASDQNWVTAAFGPNGFASANAMRFPRPAGSGSSPYGAYANQQFTLNGGGSPVNLGNPVKP